MVFQGRLHNHWRDCFKVSHLSYTSKFNVQCQAIVKVHGVFPSSRGYTASSRRFRYLRTVIVTAAVYWGFDQELLFRLHHQLTFQHRAGITPYTSTFVFAECCVFNKQLQPAGIFDRFNLRPLGTTIYAGAPSPEVTVLFCLVPSPEFSQAPEYSLPDHLCRFSVRFR